MLVFSGPPQVTLVSDIEGAEFPVFAHLADSGLASRIDTVRTVSGIYGADRPALPMPVTSLTDWAEMSVGGNCMKCILLSLCSCIWSATTWRTPT